MKKFSALCVFLSPFFLFAPPEEFIIFGPSFGHGTCFRFEMIGKTWEKGTSNLDVPPASGSFSRKGEKWSLRSEAESFECVSKKQANEFFKESLHCDFSGQTYISYNYNSIVNKGTSIKIKEEDAVFQGILSGKAKSALRVREKPDPKGKVVVMKEWKEGHASDICTSDDSVEKTSMEAGTEFRILARTQKKLKVKSSSDYWYYIAMYDKCNREIFGWSFGEFIEIGGEDKISECRFPSDH